MDHLPWSIKPPEGSGGSEGKLRRGIAAVKRCNLGGASCKPTLLVGPHD